MNLKKGDKVYVKGQIQEAGVFKRYESGDVLVDLDSQNPHRGELTVEEELIEKVED